MADETKDLLSGIAGPANPGGMDMPGMESSNIFANLGGQTGKINPMLLAAALGGLAERLDPKGIAGAVGGTAKETAGAMTTAKALGKTGKQRATGVQGFIDALQDPSNPVTSVKFDEVGNITSVGSAPPVQTPQTELGTLEMDSSGMDDMWDQFKSQFNEAYAKTYGG